MSNGGFIRSLEKIGIKCITTAVGDRFVAEKMKEEGASLGGEQSGHLIFEGGGGDGIYTALKIAQEVVRSGKSLRELGDGITRFPQLSRSIRVKDKVMVMNDKELLNTVTSLSEEMGASGRILLRPSGTEGLIRLMVEHEKQEKCKQYLELIGNMIEERWSSDSDEN
jgi:phosphoglucosamine mutase